MDALNPTPDEHALEAELAALQPAGPSPQLGWRIGRELGPPGAAAAAGRSGRHRWRVVGLIGGAAAAAAAVVVVAATGWWPAAPPARPSVVERVGPDPTAAPAGEVVVPPTLAAYRHALGRSAGAVDELLGRSPAAANPAATATRAFGPGRPPVGGASSLADLSL